MHKFLGGCVFISFMHITKTEIESSCHGSVVMNLASIHEDMGSIPGLAQRIKDPVLLWAVVWLGSGIAVAAV